MTSISRPLLAKILGRLGSAAEAEVLAAGRQADQMVRRSGMTWEDVLSGKTAPGPAVSGLGLPPDPAVFVAGRELRPFAGDRWIESVLYLLGVCDRGDLRLSGQDLRFLRSMPARLKERRIRDYEAGFLHRLKRRLDEGGAA
jgi:hypothetical protein